MHEGLKLKTKWQLIKWIDPTGLIGKLMQMGLPTPIALELFKDHIKSITSWKGNIALNEGLQLALEIISGIDTTSNKWDFTNGKLGVGDSAVGEEATQTGLQGASKTYHAIDASYPQRSNQTLEYRGTYASAEGNHSWQEFTITNDTDDTGINLNRKTADKGTKTEGESWTLSLKITGS